MHIRNFLAVVFFLLALWPPMAASAGEADIDAGRPPAGCWTTTGGNPAHSGEAQGEGIRAPFEEAWHYDLSRGFSIDEEPRVWLNRVVLATRGAGALRALHVVALGHGRPLAKPIKFTTDLPLEPSLWGEVILVRETNRTLGAYRLRKGRLQSIWKASTEQLCASPLLVGNLVYALDGGDIVCWRLPSSEPLWRARGGYHGRLSIRGGDLYALTFDEVANCEFISLDRMTGSRRSKIFVGARKGGVPRGEAGLIVALPGNVFVQHSGDIKIKEGGSIRSSWILRTDGFPGSSFHRDNGLMHYTRAPVGAGDAWLVVRADKKRGDMLTLTHNSEKDPSRSTGAALAEGKRHKAYREVPLPYTVAGRTAYAGGRAFDLDTHRIVWETGSDPHYRPVPAIGTLLVVPRGSRLTALRPRGRKQAEAVFFGPAHVAMGVQEGPATRFEGTAFFMDEAVFEGAFELKPGGWTLDLFRKKGNREKRETRPLDEVDLLLDKQGALLYASTVTDLERSLARLHYLAQADAFYKLAKAAFKTSDADLMGRLIEGASGRGIEDKRLVFPRKQQRILVTKPRKIRAKRRAKLLTQVATLEQDAAARIQRTLEGPLDDARWAVSSLFVRHFLRQDPKHAKASGLVKARLPSYVPQGGPFDALEWIDLLESFEQTPVEALEAPTREAKDLDRLQREYGSALGTWRKDLVALRGKELMILTPLAKPGRIAGCLLLGDLTCRALGEVFAVGSHVRKDPYPLIMRLYETKKEYLDASGHLGSKGRGRMEWSLGHYDAGAGLSRIFLPPKQEAWASVMSTYAHEITHHWISERCPLFESRELKQAAGIPGYWIAEGMADFVQEFRWDMPHRTWDKFNPRAESLDLVANAKSSQLIPWTRLYNMSHRDFFGVNKKDKRVIPMRWRLGYKHQASEGNMFYAQAAATCHYLYHAGAKERAQLLQYVREHYTGGLPKKQESIQNVFGISPRELGRRVLENARRLNALNDSTK